MFEVATIWHWWPFSQRFKDLKYLRNGLPRKCVLKTVGYAHVLSVIEKRRPQRVLEIGHGPTSPVFDVLHDTDVEIWGIDRFSETTTTTAGQYVEFRKRYPHGKFINGFFGEKDYGIPSDYFALVISVSVIEHVPCSAVDHLISEMSRVLRSGGISAHSIDVFLGDPQFTRQNIKDVYVAHAANRLRWAKPDTKFDITIDPANCLFEDARGIMEVYMAHQPIETRRWPGNYVSILTEAVKES